MLYSGQIQKFMDYLILKCYQDSFIILDYETGLINLHFDRILLKLFHFDLINYFLKMSFRYIIIPQIVDLTLFR